MCGTKNFASVRLYSAPQLHRTIVAILGICAYGLGYALLPYSGIYQEVEAGQLSMALLPWMRAERVLALPRGRPISRATRETAALLKEICGDLIKSGIIRTAPRTTVRPGRK